MKDPSLMFRMTINMIPVILRSGATKDLSVQEGKIWIKTESYYSYRHITVKTRS